MVNATRRLADGLFDVTFVRLAVWMWIVFTVWAGVFTDPNNIHPFMDDHQFFNWEWADRVSILKWGQLPLWNPYYCGGMVGAAAPEDGAFAPDFILRLIYGVAHGRRLALLLFSVLGMEGTYRLTRKLDGSAVAGALAAASLVLNEKVIGFLNMGWIHFCGFYLAPWAICAVVAGRTSWRWRFAGAIALGWIALAAGTYTAPYTGIAVSYVALVLIVSSLVKKRWRAAKATVFATLAIVIGAVLVALMKLLPMYLVMRQYPRVFTPSEVNDIWNLLRPYWSVHYGVVLLAIVGVLSGDRWARVFFGGCVLFLALSMGEFATWAPHAILRKLPLVSGLRFPDRYMMMFHFFAVFTAARGITKLEDVATAILRASGRLGLWLVNKKTTLEVKDRRGFAFLASGLAGAFVLYMLWDEAKAATELVKIKPHTMFTFAGPREIEQDFKQDRGNRRDAHIYPPMNRGTMYCFVGIPLPESALLRADLPEEEYPKVPGSATVTRKSWSPRAIVLDVDAPQPARILVNQNYNPHWSSDVGTVVDDEKLLAVDVPAGKHTVTLHYGDGLSSFCFVLSTSALLLMIAFIVKKRVDWMRGEAVRWKEMGVFWYGAKEEEEEDA